MVTTLFLLRHGATEGDGEARYKGSMDVPLSDLGREQVGAAGQRLRLRLETLAQARRQDYLREVHRSPGGSRNQAYCNDPAASAAPPAPHGGLPVAAQPASVDCSQPTSRIAELVGTMPAAVYCSPLDRTRESAAIIARFWGLAPLVEPDLRERHFGVWEGMSFAEIQAAWPEHFTAWAADPSGFAPPEGETTLEVARRGRAAIKKILARHPGREVVVVAHGGINRVILCHFLKLPLRHIFRIEQSLACLNVIELWDKYPVVKLLNG